MVIPDNRAEKIVDHDEFRHSRLVWPDLLLFNALPFPVVAVSGTPPFSKAHDGIALASVPEEEQAPSLSIAPCNKECLTIIAICNSLDLHGR